MSLHVSQARYYGLDELDREIARYVTAPEGVFVELGAYDGIKQSNSLHFEDRGWRGLLIEPIPEAYAKCVVNRPLATVVHCACVSFDYPHQTIDMTFSGLMSVVQGSRGGGSAEDEWIRLGESFQRLTHYPVTVPARPLSHVIDSVGLGAIDLLLLDVEGYELEVLRGLDFSRHRPHFIVIEDSNIEDGRAFLEQQGYEQKAVLKRQALTTDLLYERRAGA